METLTLEQAYYIAEIFAAIIVVLSLVFVSIQVRQNTHAILGQSMTNSIQIGQTELIHHASHEIAQVFQKSIKTPGTLTPEDIHQLNAWNIMFLVGRSNDFQLPKMGSLSEERWSVTGRALVYAFNSTWHSQWLMAGGRRIFDKDYIDWVEDILDNANFDTESYFEELQLKE